MWSKLITALVAFMFIPVVIGIGYAGGTDIYYGDADEDTDSGTNWTRDYDLIKGDTLSEQGFLNEGTETTIEITLEQINMVSITFTLTWTDEPDATGLGSYENQPDTFTLQTQKPNTDSTDSNSASNPQGGEGSITLDYNYQPDDDPYEEGTGKYNVTISCDEAGNQEPQLNIIGLREQVDNGNDWQLSIEYDYYQEKE
jgi:hypothetical protein